MAPFLIRDRRPEDRAALEEIARATHRLDGYPVYLPEDLGSFIMDADALVAWVAEQEGEVVGHVALHGESSPEVMDVLLAATGMAASEVVMVARLLVAPSCRGTGIGRALLARAALGAARLGRRAALDVVREHRAAIALYDRCGWELVGSVDWELPGGRPLSELVYVSPAGGGTPA